MEAEPKAIWIVKPPASSCGRGIRVINKGGVGSVSKTKKGLVQVRLWENAMRLHQRSHLCLQLMPLIRYARRKTLIPIYKVLLRFWSSTLQFETFWCEFWTFCWEIKTRRKSC